MNYESQNEYWKEKWILKGFGRRKFILFFCNLQAIRGDRIYVNTPVGKKGDDRDVQILSVSKRKNSDQEIGTENKAITKDVENEEDRGEDGLTPADLMAFAWQISQGMVNLYAILSRSRPEGSNTLQSGGRYSALHLSFSTPEERRKQEEILILSGYK